MALALTISAAATTVIGTALGAALARRVLSPLRVTCEVARRVSSRELSLRLPATRDREVTPLYESLNGMVDALAARIEREQRFAADVSHELRTPLTALVSSVAVLERNGDQLPDRAQLVERVVRSRPTGQPELRIGPLPGPILLDPRRIERVMVNLLDNADVYAGGAVAVTVAGGGEVVELIVDDAGPGVAPTEREAIFERLHRGDAARQSNHRGSDLGLALASELLRVQRGSIRVCASPAGGARFVARLPMRLAEPGAP